MIKTIFIGTPDFAIPSLESLIKDDFFNIVGVITQPDKPSGRKQIITPPPVKLIAQKYNIPVFQPKKIASFASKILELKPDLIVVAAYSQIIPKSILDIPKYGCVNVHGSLLPKYRGAACIQAPILAGDKESGVTIIQMDKGLDTGPILAQKSIKIQKEWTAGALFSKISTLGAEILIPALKQYLEGKIKPMPQDPSQASYVGKISKRDGRIDWSKPAEHIERLVRAMNPWPGAYAKKQKNNKTIKIIKVESETLKINQYKAGELFLYENKLAVQCGRNALAIKKLQLEGKKILDAKNFLQGNNIVGNILK